MGLFDTTAKEVAAERLKEARKELKDLQGWLKEIDKEMERFEKDKKLNGRAFPCNWVSVMMEKALGIYNEVSRCNGAVLVRSTK